jgi:hypothetical protein
LSGERTDQLLGHLLDINVKIMAGFASGCAYFAGDARRRALQAIRKQGQAGSAV